MSALPYMPLYVADYLADTAHLTALENGAYLMLIMNYWQRGNSLPGGGDQLARIARVTPEEWAKIGGDLQEFFEVVDGRWVHSRIETELAKVREKSIKASNAGKASAQRKHSERSTPVEQTLNHTDTDTDIPNPLARDAKDWDVLETKCREAAGWQRETNPMLAVIGPIAGLIEAGCDLDLDVLPTIKAKAHGCRGSKTWKYFIGAIQQARDDRLGAMTAPKPSTHNGTPRHAAHSKPNSIIAGFAGVDAYIAERERELAALESSENERAQSAFVIS